MVIINKSTKSVEEQPWRTKNWMGEEWVEVPPALREKAFSCAGFCDLVLQGDVLIDIIPTEKPEIEQDIGLSTEQELTQQDITDLQLSDIEQGQALTDLELMIMEGQANV